MGRWKADGQGGGYYDPNDNGPDQVSPQMPQPMQGEGASPWTRYGGITGGMTPGGPDPYDAGQIQLPQVMHTDPATGEALTPEQWYQRQGGQQKMPGGLFPSQPSGMLPMDQPGAATPSRLSSLFGGTPMMDRAARSPFQGLKAIGSSVGRKTLGGLIGGWF